MLYIHSPHLQSLRARDTNSQPFDYESDSLTIRPRLPPKGMRWLGNEPGSTAWKAAMLTTIPPMQANLSGDNDDRFHTIITTFWHESRTDTPVL